MRLDELKWQQGSRREWAVIFNRMEVYREIKPSSNRNYKFYRLHSYCVEYAVDTDIEAQAILYHLVSVPIDSQTPTNSEQTE